MNDDLLDIADELYGLPMADFTPARDAKAKELKGSDLAAPVKALKKPTMAAWVVNMLVRHETEQVDQVLAVGAALRDAAESLDGKELRELTKQRRQLTAAVTTRARGVVGALGTKVTQAVADQVESTLTAAMLDPECAKALRSGLLVTHLTSTGLGESAAGAAVALPEALGFAATSAPPKVEAPVGRPDLKVVPDPDAEAKKLAAAEAALEAAAAAEEAARTTYDGADQAVTELEARSLQVQGEIEEHQRQIAELERDRRGGRGGARRGRGGADRRADVAAQGRAGPRAGRDRAGPAPQEGLADPAGGRAARQLVAVAGDEPVDRVGERPHRPHEEDAPGPGPRGPALLEGHPDRAGRVLDRAVVDQPPDRRRDLLGGQAHGVEVEELPGHGLDAVATRQPGGGRGAEAAVAVEDQALAHGSSVAAPQRAGSQSAWHRGGSWVSTALNSWSFAASNGRRTPSSPSRVRSPLASLTTTETAGCRAR